MPLPTTFEEVKAQLRETSQNEWRKIDGTVNLFRKHRPYVVPMFMVTMDPLSGNFTVVIHGPGKEIIPGLIEDLNQAFKNGSADFYFTTDKDN